MEGHAGDNQISTCCGECDDVQVKSESYVRTVVQYPKMPKSETPNQAVFPLLKLHDVMLLIRDPLLSRLPPQNTLDDLPPARAHHAKRTIRNPMTSLGLSLEVDTRLELRVTRVGGIVPSEGKREELLGEMILEERHLGFSDVPQAVEEVVVLLRDQLPAYPIVQGHGHTFVRCFDLLELHVRQDGVFPFSPVDLYTKNTRSQSLIERLWEEQRTHCRRTSSGINPPTACGARFPLLCCASR